MDDDRDLIAKALKIELDGKDYGELHQIKDQIREARDVAAFAVNSMKAQIESARMQVDVGNHAPDRDWWLRINNALQIMRTQREQLHEKFIEAKKRAHQLRPGGEVWHDKRAKAFVRVAETQLPCEMLERLWKLVDQGGGSHR